MAFPLTDKINEMEFYTLNPNLITRSLSGYEQRAQLDTPRFQIIAALRNLSDEDRRTLMGYIIDRQGSLSSFDLPLPGGLGDSSAGYTGTITLSSQADVGDTSITVSAGVNNTKILKTGDLIRFAGKNKTYSVTADATTNGSGVAVVSLNPGVLETVSAGNTITHRDVNINVRFDGDSFAHALNSTLYSNYQLTFVEVF